MPVSGKTAAPWEIPYLEESDIPDMGAGDKAIAERLHAILNGSNQQALSWLKSSEKAGQIIVCNKSGVPQYVTPSGDVSLSESGDFELGKGVVGTEEVADKAITLGKLAKALGLTEEYLADKAVGEAKVADGAVTAAKLAANSVPPTKLVEEVSVKTETVELATPEAFLIDLLQGTSAQITTIGEGGKGQFVILRGRTGTVTVKNGTGNIVLAGSDFVISERDTLMLVFSSNNKKWHEVARSNNT